MNDKPFLQIKNIEKLLRLKRSSGLTDEEIGNVFGVSRQAVNVTYHKWKSRIKE